MTRIRALLGRLDVRYLSVLVVPAFVAVLLLTRANSGSTPGSDPVSSTSQPVAADVSPAVSDLGPAATPPDTARHAGSGSGSHGSGSHGSGGRGGSGSGNGNGNDAGGADGGGSGPSPPAVLAEASAPIVLVAVPLGIVALILAGGVVWRRRGKRPAPAYVARHSGGGHR